MYLAPLFLQSEKKSGGSMAVCSFICFICFACFGRWQFWLHYVLVRWKWSNIGYVVFCAVRYEWWLIGCVMYFVAGYQQECERHGCIVSDAWPTRTGTWSVARSHHILRTHTRRGLPYRAQSEGRRDLWLCELCICDLSISNSHIVQATLIYL